MVGTPGFEPGASRTPSVRATRLRYVPTACFAVRWLQPEFLNAGNFHPIGRKPSPLTLRIRSGRERRATASRRTISVSLGFENRQQ